MFGMIISGGPSRPSPGPWRRRPPRSSAAAGPRPAARPPSAGPWGAGPRSPGAVESPWKHRGNTMGRLERSWDYRTYMNLGPNFWGCWDDSVELLDESEVKLSIKRLGGDRNMLDFMMDMKGQWWSDLLEKMRTIWRFLSGLLAFYLMLGDKWFAVWLPESQEDWSLFEPEGCDTHHLAYRHMRLPAIPSWHLLHRFCWILERA